MKPKLHTSWNVLNKIRVKPNIAIFMNLSKFFHKEILSEEVLLFALIHDQQPFFWKRATHFTLLQIDPMTPELEAYVSQLPLERFMLPGTHWPLRIYKF